MQFEKWYPIDLLRPPTHAYDLGMILYTGDGDSVIVGAVVTRDGDPVTLAGTVQGYVILPDGSTPPAFAGTIDGNRVSVTLPETAMVLSGRITLAIRVINGDEKTVVMGATAMVRRTSSESAYDPDAVIPTWDQVLVKIAALDTAVEAAQGVVNASVRYDTAQTLTDAQKAQARTNIGAGKPTPFKIVAKPVITDFEKGSLANNPPTPTTWYANARMRTIDPMVCYSDLIVDINTANYSTAAFIVYLYADDMATAYTGSWVTHTRIPAGTPFKLLVSPNPGVATNYSLETIFGLMTFTVWESIRDIDTLTVDLFENGSIDAGNNVEYGYKARIRTCGILRANRRFAVKMDTTANANAALSLHLFDAKGQYLSSSGWVDEAIIQPGECFRLLMTLDNTSVPGSSAANVNPETVFAGAYIDNDAGSEAYPRMIAHQGKTDGVENYCKLEGVIKAGQKGYHGVEVDIKRTSDGQIVCSHDTTFTDATSGDTVTIASSTLTALKACDYYGGKIATLDEVVAACKRYNLDLYLDQLSAAYNKANWDTMFGIIRKYGWMDHTWFICYNTNDANNVLSRVSKPKIEFSEQWGADDLTALVAFADTYAERCGEVAIVFFLDKHTESAITAAIAGMNPWYHANVYPFDTVAHKRAFAKYAHAAITNTNVALYPEE